MIVSGLLEEAGDKNLCFQEVAFYQEFSVLFKVALEARAERLDFKKQTEGHERGD